MTVATGSLCDLGYVPEVTFGVTPNTPSLTKIRRVTSSLNLEKESYQSEEQRTDRATADLRHGVRTVGGNIDGELSVATWDDFLEALMGGTWTTGVTADESDFTSITSTTSTFTAAGGSWITKGFRKGDVIMFTNLADAANNNKKFTITNITASVITVAETVVAQASPDSDFDVVVVGKKLGIGNTYRSFSIERAFTDITQFTVYKGCRMNTLNLDVPASGIVKCTFGVTGQDASALSGSSVDASYSAAPTNSPLAAVSGQLLEGGVVQAVVTGLTLNINNGIDGKAVIGRNTKPDLLWGKRQEVSGELTVLFQDATLFNKFVNETESELLVRIDDPNGTDFLKIYLPRIKYSGGNIGDDDPQGLPLTLPFTALVASASGSATSPLNFQRSNS